jgi:Xaa-Pro dipeptidase
MPPPVATPPSAEELNRRLSKVRELMKEEELDVYVSFDPVNIYYLTNFMNYVQERPFLLIIGREGNPTMLAPLLELSHVKARARLELDCETYTEFPAPEGENWYDVYASLIDNDAKVGIESTMPVGIAYETPGECTVHDIVDEARLIKSEYEIGRNVHACSILNMGHQKLLDICRPGVPEVSIYSEVTKAMMGKTFQDIPEANMIVTKFIAGVWPPSISHDPHRVPKPLTPMEEGGPHVSIITGQVDGYGVEIERTFFLGNVPENTKKPFQIMMDARATAYEMATPGTVLSDIDVRVRNVFSYAGYAGNILHRTGHGFGITGHEGPFVAIGDDRELAPGMLISIEPGIYIPGVGGFRHSDTVLITEEGPLSLTKAPETLEELTFS